MSAGRESAKVEMPLIRQLVGMGWLHVEGSASDPAVTGRESFRDVILIGRLRAALAAINPGPDGKPWLDETRLAQALAPLTRPRATRLIEANKELTELLLLGTLVDGVAGWHDGNQQRVRYIDWDRPERNDFLVVNQFRVDEPGGQGRRYVTPDLVLFVNGIPLVVIEAKAPDQAEPIAKAIEQLRRYANQRGSARPEGNERLFHTNQFVVATCFDRALAGTFTSGPEHFAEWKTTEPTPESDVAAKLGVTALSSQERLVAGMLEPTRLLDIVRHFTVFMPAGDRTVKVVARYQQYRAVSRALRRLTTGATRLEDGESDRRGGIVWHTQGSGKSLTMVFLIRAMRSHPDLVRFKVVVVTDRIDLEKQLRETAELTGETVVRCKSVKEVRERLGTPGKMLAFAMIQKARNPKARKDDEARLKSLGVLDTSEDILVLVDEAHRSHSSQLHAHLMEALPNCARIGFTGTPIIMGARTKTHAIFGDFIDQYRIKESEEDGATVPILYEGRTSKSAVRDAADLDELFDDMFADRTPDELEAIKRRWATTGNVLEAPKLIAAKARNMLRHYVDVVLPNGFKAQVVASSRRAAVRYREAFLAARDALVADIDSLPDHLRTPEAADRADELDTATARLVRAWPYRNFLAAMEFVPVISGEHNDPDGWSQWTDKTRQEQVIKQFKEKGNPVAFLIVNAMLLTGFDAPLEQVLYLDRGLKEAELLQAIARVNRTAPHKTVGYVVDYYGVASHLQRALEAYAAEDIHGALSSIADELPLLAERHQRLANLLTPHGDPTTEAGREACVEALADERLRLDFQRALKDFTASLETVLPRPEALPYVPAAKAFGAIALAARHRYRDTSTFDPSLYGAKVRRLIDDHIDSLGIRNRIPPISITAVDFDHKVGKLPRQRTRAAEMEHALRYHLSERMDEDPERYRRLSERLEEIIERLGQQWDQLELELAELIAEARAGRQVDDTGLDPVTEAPFYDLLAAEAASSVDKAILRGVTADLVRLIKAEITMVGFWHNAYAQETLRSRIVNQLDDQQVDGEGIFTYERLSPLADRIVDLARANHARLVASS